MTSYQSRDALSCYPDNPALENVPNPPTVVKLLAEGWRVIHVATSAGGASSSGYQRPYLVVFVLESPAPVAPAQSSVDLKRIWQSAYKSKSSFTNESVAREFANQVVAAVVDATPEGKTP